MAQILSRPLLMLGKQNVLSKLSSSKWAIQLQIKNFSVSSSTYFIYFVHIVVVAAFDSFTQSHTSLDISLYLFSFLKNRQIYEAVMTIVEFLLLLSSTKKKFCSSATSSAQLSSDKVNRRHCSSNDFYQI